MGISPDVSPLASLEAGLNPILLTQASTESSNLSSYTSFYPAIIFGMVLVEECPPPLPNLNPSSQNFAVPASPKFQPRFPSLMPAHGRQSFPIEPRFGKETLGEMLRMSSMPRVLTPTEKATRPSYFTLSPKRFYYIMKENKMG